MSTMEKLEEDLQEAGDEADKAMREKKSLRTQVACIEVDYDLGGSLTIFQTNHYGWTRIGFFDSFQ